MNKNLSLFQFILNQLDLQDPVMLLLVAESEGSSPGRPGFKLAIATDGELQGSIGGGIMEVKLVELGKKLLAEASTHPFLKKQIHSKNVPLHQSGMICSGEQTVLYFMITPDQAPVILQIIDQLQQLKNGVLTLAYEYDEVRFEVNDDFTLPMPVQFDKRSEDDFLYRESLGFPHHLYIIGGGHCALALSDIMSKLRFYIHVWDDRPHLNTMELNVFAHEKQVVDSYARIGEQLPSGEHIYVVVMTLGYRSDMEALLSMKDHSFGYLGVLGSETKIELIRQELDKQGFPVALSGQMHAPIGVKINSHTPEEIAVSIAAEIIRHRNSS